MPHLRIRDADHLKMLLEEKEQLDCFLSLGGPLISSKTFLHHSDGSVTVYHDIDGHQRTYKSVEGLCRNPQIREAIEQKRLFVYDFEIKAIQEKENDSSKVLS